MGEPDATSLGDEDAPVLGGKHRGDAIAFAWQRGDDRVDGRS